MTTPIARILLLAAVVSGCGEAETSVDAGADADAPCTNAAGCDDGLFCTGMESCTPDSPLADARGCIAAAAPPCAVAMCNEAQDVCGGCDDDLDGDGARSIACGGNDCDDEDETRFPGNLEVCDVAGVDEDCDPLSLGDVDLDEDQQVDDACCNGARCGLDCDDQRSNVHRLAPEVCDGFDNNCNTETDEGLLVNSWPDLDEDDYGDAAATPTTGCSVPTGRADRGGDCDDGNDAIHPDADEPCNAVDDDCDDMTDEGGAAACETEFPGSVALCTSGECIITGCTGNRFDCNGSFTDGCEVDVCTSVASCDGCNFPCWEAGAYCSGGECSHQRATASSGGTLRDVTTGEPIAGATITFIGTCATYTATTNAAGEYDLPHRPVSWARIEAPGYPTHIQPRNDDTGFGPIVSQAALDAWLATQTVTVDPTRAIILANMLPDGAPGDLIFTARDGTQLYADANVLTPGDTGDRVLMNVLPGRATVGGSREINGCYYNCGPLVELMLEAGAVTVAGGFSCVGVCS
ncbi:MAG: putative metal-binding motif-containing protein [Sandaracinaceae bacterium]|nr:putative metal-binding motif-containing protein [Sandaracinaceae bacterium]